MIKDPCLHWKVWLLTPATFAIGTDALSIAGILPLIAGDAHARIEEAAQIVVAYSVACAVGAPLLAVATARLPRIPLAVGALFGFALADAVAALAAGLWTLTAARVVAGASAAIFVSSAYAIAADFVRPQRQDDGVGVVAFGTAISTVIGVPVTVWLGHAASWRMTFACVALLAAGAATALWIAAGGVHLPALARTSFGRRFVPVRHPSILLAMLPNAICAAATTTVYTFLTEILREAHPSLSLEALLLVYGVGGLIGSQTGSVLSAHYGAAQVTMVVLLMNAVNLGLLHLTFSWGVVSVVSVFTWGFAGWFIFSAQQGRLVRFARRYGGTVLTLNQSCIYFGSATGTALGAQLRHAGLPSTSLTGAAVALLLLALATLAFGGLPACARS
jgi:DHA1 family inner membrane transport protein